jgi:SAM-dependent methyltransferase
MGIAPYVAEAVIREHKHRAIRGDVLLLGRQTMQFSPEHAADMIKAVGLVPAALVDDDSVIDRRTWKAEGQRYIGDDAFFRLLGVPAVRALDHSSYEGAEVIHDLNKPIPYHMENSTDFILDGSTLDNLFSPATAIQSVARMLRPGGRFLSVNMQSFHSDSYSLTNPYWFLDFFTVNRFADCRVYATTHGDRGELNVYAVDPTARRDRAFRPLEVTGLMVFAEKGADSTWEAIPSQRYYSAADEIEKRIAAGRRFAQSGRPELLLSIRPKPFSRLRQIQQILLAENRTVEDFRLVLAGGQKVKVPESWMLSLARLFRRFKERRSGRR